MKAQSMVRLPALNFIVKDARQALSQDYFDYNNSNTSIVNNPRQSSMRLSQQNSPSPLKRRGRGFTIAVYNSQEKFKTAEYRNLEPSGFITQTIVQNTTVVNTANRQRANNRLRNMIIQKSDKNDELQLQRVRDPRYYSFKECATAQIKLHKLNEPTQPDQESLRIRVQQLMKKAQQFVSLQSYQKQQTQDTYQVTLVRLKDDYECLCQDFNDFYVTTKKMDPQILSLQTHIEVIQKLLITRPLLQRQPSLIFTQPVIVDEPQVQLPSPKEEVIYTAPIIEAPLAESRKSSSVMYQKEEDPDMSDMSLQKIDLQQSEHQPTDTEVDTSPKSKSSRLKKTRLRFKTTKNLLGEGSSNSITPIHHKQQSNRNNDTDEEQFENSPTYRTQQQSRKSSINLQLIPTDKSPLQSDRSPVNEQDSSNSEIRSSFRRTSTVVGNVQKRRSIIVQGPNGPRRRVQRLNSKNEIIEVDESINSSFQSGNEDLYEGNAEDPILEDPPHYDFGLIDKLLEWDNIYQFPYYQLWDYHFDMIAEAKPIGEFDL